MSVVTRFAPSPTGFLHIGGARTALFNWLFTRRHGGTYRLRIEDTDRKRSTVEAIAAIVEGLKWLELDWDGEIVFQSRRLARHGEVARQMLAAGTAYRCYSTPEELTQMRERARAEGRPIRYDGTWRERDPCDAPAGVAPAIRLKAPQTGETLVEDRVQGPVRVANGELDDMILLRSDGTPTYMHSVVVDDHDMAITHVIRGDDHFSNTFRQLQIYHALDWPTPAFAHIPLLHGPDGAKLSKRHGALGVEAYRDMGFLPEAMRNYLLRLGWAHGDDETIATEQAILWFELDGVGRSPSRVDMAKLQNLNAHYIREAEAGRLADAIMARLAADGRPKVASDVLRGRLLAGMDGLRPRAKTLVELADLAAFYGLSRPLALDGKAAKLLDGAARERLAGVHAALANAGEWTESGLDAIVRNHAEQRGVKLGDMAQPLRAALTGSTVSPGIFEVMAVLGPEESRSRLADAIAGLNPV
ncbi:MAG: glutamate--tRNA ligase [Alphaproteobacteria bacterium]|nr:glutamate--tRNA ligase [Alphaproteobacteria bacterium]